MYWCRLLSSNSHSSGQSICAGCGALIIITFVNLVADVFLMMLQISFAVTNVSNMVNSISINSFASESCNREKTSARERMETATIQITTVAIKVISSLIAPSSFSLSLFAWWSTEVPHCRMIDSTLQRHKRLVLDRAQSQQMFPVEMSSTPHDPLDYGQKDVSKQLETKVLLLALCTVGLWHTLWIYSFSVYCMVRIFISKFGWNK